jgi:very-short-patch-repair endonuclease
MLDISYIIREYQAGKSPYLISEELTAKGVKCYPNLVRRALQKNGFILRGKSAAQANSLKTNRSSHPTQGRKRTAAEKFKISKSISESWSNLTDEELLYRRKISKDKWDKMTPDEKECLRVASAKAIREAAETGSKIEKFLLLKLTQLNYRVDFHSKNLLPTQKLQVDLFLPDLGVAIEVDGPSHFEPVWGEEALAKTKHADQEKNGLLLGRGYCVIRLRAGAKNISMVYQQRLLDKLVPILDNIKSRKGVLPIEERLIYIGDE